MRGMVFAAGLGTRLRPLTDVLPKPLCPVGPWPLIRYAVETLKAAGIIEIAINTFHLGAKLPAAMGDGSAWGVKITWSHESPDLGSATGGRSPTERGQIRLTHAEARGHRVGRAVGREPVQEPEPFLSDGERPTALARAAVPCRSVAR